MKVVQTSLTRAATLDVGSDIVELLSAPLDRGRGLLVVQRNRMAIFDVTSAAAPVLLDDARMEGVSGIVRAEDGTFLAWGVSGVQRVSTARGRIQPLQQITNTRAWGVIATDRGWASVSENGLEFRRTNMEVCERVELPAACPARLIVARRQPAIVYADGRTAVLGGGGTQWQDVGHLTAAIDWARSVRVECAGRPMVYAPARDGGGFIVDFDSAARPNVVAWYRETPWFVRSLRIGELTAVTGRDVVLYQTRAERVL
jgi:hypothetical protein